MLHDLMGDEADLLLQALDEEPVTSVRINRRKPVVEFENTQPVSWCKSGLYLKERPEFIFDPLLHAGTYYVQDASSMIYETVVDCILPLCSHERILKVLDLCAAPGGKTTAMINALPDGTQVVANEFSPKRVGALKENLERWGYACVTVTNKDTLFYAKQGEQFDIVAVDAPCSGEGMMRKEEVARTQWSPALIEHCVGLQREILTNAFSALKPGGFLIYSTCTFNRHENEENAEWLAQHFKMQNIDLSFPKEWDIPRGFNTGLSVYRFMPHKTRGEGLFLAVFKKPEFISLEGTDDGEALKETFEEKQVGRTKGNSVKTRPRFQTNPGSKEKSEYPKVNVDRETAIKYLQGEAIMLPADTPKGLVSVCYRDFPLGDAKNIGSRANNLYPKNKRILKR